MVAMSNPALNDKIFQRETGAATAGAFEPGWAAPEGQAPGGPVGPVGGSDTMRVSGALTASAVLLAILVVAGWFGWQAVTVTVTGQQPDGTDITQVSLAPWLWVSWLVGLGLAIVTIFKPKLARITAPLYAVAQGLMVGAISHAFEADFDGIVLQAIGLTIGVFVMMLVLYATGTVKVTPRLRLMIFAATGAIAIVYLVNLVMSFFGASVPMIHDAGPVGIGFSLLVVGIAASNLLLDFDFIDRGAAMGAPRYMEWFAAFGLMITLVWLYLEMLRLLSKLRR
jgi:uncharacterized YccA/Bax inhibitor family protein